MSHETAGNFDSYISCTRLSVNYRMPSGLEERLEQIQVVCRYGLVLAFFFFLFVFSGTLGAAVSNLQLSPVEADVARPHQITWCLSGVIWAQLLKHRLRTSGRLFKQTDITDREITSKQRSRRERCKRIACYSRRIKRKDTYVVSLCCEIVSEQVDINIARRLITFRFVEFIPLWDQLPYIIIYVYLTIIQPVHFRHPHLVFFLWPCSFCV